MPSGSLIGATLSHFRVTGLLGAGGMGEVYRAEDTTLGREVAIKVLPPAFVADGERVARFEREARTLASLSHPNIGAIHEVGHEDGTHFLVLELVPGETLADRLARGPLPLDEALPIALQIAAALEAAHERGIVHRDLKPGNVMVDEDGRVKVLDFGLAKALSADAGSASGGAADPHSPTLTHHHATQAGVLLGTAAYMSPEQARGKAADTRADVWAFGVVLWEMLTGRHLFAGETVSDVLAAILRQELDARELPADTPASVRRVLRLCLQRDARQRLRHIGDAALLLAPGEEAPAAGAAAPAPARRQRLPWIAAAGLAALALLLGLLWWRERGSPRPRLVTSEIAAPPGSSLRLEEGLALSPDGRRVVFGASGSDGKVRLWLRPLHGATASPLPGTEGASYPFWSPDSQHVAFFSAGRMRRVPVAGGPPQSLCDIEDARGGSWSRAGEIVFASSWRGGLEAIAASGGARRKLTTPDGSVVVSHRWPWFLPDGKRLLFLAQAAEGGTPGDRSTIELLDLQSGEHQKLVEANSSMAYSTTGHLLYWRDGALLAHPFDAGAGSMAGDYVPLAEDVAITGNELAVFTIAAEGTLLYGADTSGGRASQMVWVDRSGKRLGEITGPGRYYQPALSPDGARLAYGLDNDLWIHDLQKDSATRFTFGGAVAAGPVWSPDGRWLAYTAYLGGANTVLYRRPSSGLGEPEELLRLADAAGTAAWGPDGRHLYFFRFQSGKDYDIWRLDLHDGKTAAVVSTPALEADPALSPDGRWLAYGSNESARFELYVRPLAGQGGRWQLSREGGEQPKWSPDARTLYFLAEDGSMMGVEVEAGETFRAGEPVELFATPVAIDETGDFDLHPDGDRFVINWPLTSSEERAVLVQEWPRLLASSNPR